MTILLPLSRARSLWLALALLLVPRLAAAQQPDLHALYDSLSSVDATQLPQLRDRAKVEGTSVNALMQQGLALARIAELTRDGETASQARQAFERAAELEPRNVWPRFGIALAHLASPEIRLKAFGGIFSKLTIAQVAAEVVKEDPRSRAIRELRRALEIDSAFVPAAVVLANLALESREDDELVAARAALRNIFPRNSDPELTILVADIAVALRDLQLAQSAANAIARVAPDSSVAQHVIAGVFLRIPGQEEHGAVAYRAGIDRLTELGAQRYYDDVKMLATDLEKAQWLDALDKKGLEHRAVWLRKFWSMRAARSVTTELDRIAEHYRRLDIARTRFRRSQKRGTPEPNSVVELAQKISWPYDDRGNIYLRYGEADKVIRTLAEGLHPNETWVYNNIEGERKFFHFVASRSAYDFVMIDNVFAAAQDLASTESVIKLLEDRTTLDPRYALFAVRLRGLQHTQRGDSVIEEMRGAYPTTEALTSIRHESDILSEIYRRDAEIALRRDAATADFDTPIPFYYDLYGFKGESGRTEMTIAVAIPGNLVRGRAVDGRVVYSIDVSAILIDTLDSRVERRDTTLRLWSSRPLRPNENIRFHLNLNATPSSSTIHRLMVRNTDDPGAGMIYGGPSAVPEFRGPQLMISEILLADSLSSGPWQRDLVKLSLLPPRQITSNRLFSLFYEIYNLPTSVRYRTEILISPVDGNRVVRGLKGLLGGRNSEIRLSFEEQSDANLGGTDQELRRVLADLAAGKYRVRIRVTNLQTSETAMREKLFRVVNPEDEKK